MTAHNDYLLDLYGIEKIKPVLIPYFCYYASQYTPEILADALIFEIPYKDGSRKLDKYFINILIANNWSISENWILSKFYAIKTLKRKEPEK
jgi:hypothetical protein